MPQLINILSFIPAWSTTGRSFCSKYFCLYYCTNTIKNSQNYGQNWKWLWFFKNGPFLPWPNYAQILGSNKASVGYASKSWVDGVSDNLSIKAILRVFPNQRKQAKTNIISHFPTLLVLKEPPCFWIFQIR